MGRGEPACRIYSLGKVLAMAPLRNVTCELEGIEQGACLWAAQVRPALLSKGFGFDFGEIGSG